MAGTIFGLGLSQRVDTNGNPDSGWLLYLYSANSSTPVTAYKDTALTAGLEHPWPIEADSNGMMPSFWLADGSYRARATSNDGARTFYDLGSVLALGASAGAAPSGGVDSTTIFQTGDVMWLDVSGTRSGWVRDNGRTIGSATSGASERANADCQALFSYIWNNFSDTACPVLTGRGANASADWAANKQITLPDKRGRSPFGLDDMGNSAASRFASVPFTQGDAITAGALGGESLHSLAKSEIPTGLFTLSDPGHTHTVTGSNTGITASGPSIPTGNGYGTAGIALTTNTTGVSITDHAGGTSHNNMPPFVLGTFYRKL